MKKTIAILLGVLTIIGTAIPVLAINTNGGETISMTTTASLEPEKPIGMPSPIEEFNTLQDAQNSLDFKTVIPEGISKEFKIKYISTISKQTFQICYTDGEDDILFRMGQGVSKIDGDYNEYKFNTVVQVDDKNITLSGNNTLVNLATWKIADMSYSISVTNGLEKDDIIEIVKSVL